MCGTHAASAGRGCAVDEEAHPRPAGVLEQPVGLADGGERLAGAGRHLHERSGPVVGEGFLDGADRIELGGRSPVRSSGGRCRSSPRNVPTARCRCRAATMRASVSGRWSQWTSRERATGSSRLLKSLLAGRLVRERQRRHRRVPTLELPVGVPRGLRLDADERHAALLRLEHADGGAVDEQDVVGGAVAACELHLAKRHAGDLGARRLRREFACLTSRTTQPAASSMRSMSSRA